MDSWRLHPRERLVGHTVNMKGSFFLDSAPDEKANLFKAQIVRYDKNYKWRGEYSKTRQKGAFFIVEFGDRLLTQHPIALRVSGQCLPTYIATHGLNKALPADSSVVPRGPAFLQDARKRKRKATTGDGSKGSNKSAKRPTL